MIKRTFAAGLAALSLMAAGCSGDDTGTATDTASSTGGGSETGGETGGSDGREYYDGAEAAGLGAANNQATCATCHSNDGSQDGWSGNSFKDLAFHESFKGDGTTQLLGAMNACITGWMGGTPLTETDAAYLGLKKYMESISSPDMTTASTITPVVLADEAEYEAAYAGGDAAAGAAAYTKACAVCHDSALLLGAATALPKASLGAFTIGRIAQKVRTSGPPPSGTNDAADSTPGPMPFFEAKDISAQDLTDIIAHLKG